MSDGTQVFTCNQTTQVTGYCCVASELSTCFCCMFKLQQVQLSLFVSIYILQCALQSRGFFSFKEFSCYFNCRDNAVVYYSVCSFEPCSHMEMEFSWQMKHCQETLCRCCGVTSLLLKREFSFETNESPCKKK